MIIAPEFLFKLPLVTIIITAINIFIFVTTWRMNKSTKHKIDNLKKNIETLNELNKFRHDQDNNMLDMKKALNKINSKLEKYTDDDLK